MNKKKKRVMALLIALVLVISIIPDLSDSKVEAGTPSGTNATFKEEFNSLYQKVIQDDESGYFSKSNGECYPYHAAEEFYIDEDVDYGHLSTAEDASDYANVAMHYDTLNNADGEGTEFTKAWDSSMSHYTPYDQVRFLSSGDEPSVAYVKENEYVNQYPSKEYSGNTGKNFLWSQLNGAYGGTSDGLDLYQWLVDPDDWYGYGNGSPCFINTFERGWNESVWETIPHPAYEEKKYGDRNRGIWGIYTTDSMVEKQYRYRSTGAAERKVITAVVGAIQSGIATPGIKNKAATIADELRNTMVDKYYKEIGCQNMWIPTSGYDSMHYLFGNETQWGIAYDAAWKWQTGSSRICSADQDPYLIYQILHTEAIKNGMLSASDQAAKDYNQALSRQLEFLGWLQSSTGPIGWGATNSWGGEHTTYPTGTSTFYELAYCDTAGRANNELGIEMQTDAILPVAKLYQLAEQDQLADQDDFSLLVEQCETILDKWIYWILAAVKLNDDGSYTIPDVLEWQGGPDEWTGSTPSNLNFTANVKTTSNCNFEAASDIATILMYYAKAKTVGTEHAYEQSTDLGEKALYTARELMKRSIDQFKDEKGMAVNKTISPDYQRMFEQEVWVPSGIDITLPTSGKVNSETKFIDVRPQYKNVDGYSTLENDYQANGDIKTTKMSFHVFSEQCAAMEAFATAAELYPSMGVTILEDEPTPTPTATPTPGPSVTATPTSTPTPTPTATPAVTSTVTPTAAPTVSPMPTETSVPSLTAQPRTGVNQIRVSWRKLTKNKKLKGYEVRVSKSNGKKIKASDINCLVSKKKQSVVITKIKGMPLEEDQTYQVKVLAYKIVKGKKVYLGQSTTFHVAGSENSTYTNAKKVKLAKSSVRVKAGKKTKLKATIIKQNKAKLLLPKSYGKQLIYRTSKSKVATVSSKGVVKGKKKGSCTICIYAQNGVRAVVKVKVV